MSAVTLNSGAQSAVQSQVSGAAQAPAAPAAPVAVATSVAPLDLSKRIATVEEAKQFLAGNVLQKTDTLWKERVTDKTGFFEKIGETLSYYFAGKLFNRGAYGEAFKLDRAVTKTTKEFDTALTNAVRAAFNRGIPDSLREPECSKITVTVPGMQEKLTEGLKEGKNIDIYNARIKELFTALNNVIKLKNPNDANYATDLPLYMEATADLIKKRGDEEEISTSSSLFGAANPFSRISLPKTNQNHLCNEFYASALTTELERFAALPLEEICKEGSILNEAKALQPLASDVAEKDIVNAICEQIKMKKNKTLGTENLAQTIADLLDTSKTPARVAAKKAELAARKEVLDKELVNLQKNKLGEDQQGAIHEAYKLLNGYVTKGAVAKDKDGKAIEGKLEITVQTYVAEGKDANGKEKFKLVESTKIIDAADAIVGKKVDGTQLAEKEVYVLGSLDKFNLHMAELDAKLVQNRQEALISTDIRNLKIEDLGVATPALKAAQKALTLRDQHEAAYDALLEKQTKTTAELTELQTKMQDGVIKTAVNKELAHKAALLQKIAGSHAVDNDVFAFIQADGKPVVNEQPGINTAASDFFDAGFNG